MDVVSLAAVTGNWVDAKVSDQYLLQKGDLQGFKGRHPMKTEARPTSMQAAGPPDLGSSRGELFSSGEEL